MRGRTPAGPKYVDRLQGSELAKQRLKTILETIAGDCRVSEACERLNICEQRFHQLRQQALELALTGLEPRSPGRPARSSSPADEEIERLREELAAKDLEMRTTRAREEIALAMPRIVPPATPTTASPTSASSPPGEPEKKTTHRPNGPNSQTSSTRGKKKST
jgi:Helix-turn-helix domain